MLGFRRGWHDPIPLGDKGFRKRQRFEGSNLELAKKRTRHETVPDCRGIRGCPEDSPHAVDSGEINEYATKPDRRRAGDGERATVQLMTKPASNADLRGAFLVFQL